MVGISEFAFAKPPPDEIVQEPQNPPNTDGEQRIAKVLEDLGACTRCRLHTERSKLVFGEGNHEAQLVFVGEGPGVEEDKQGRPFVGKAGKLLDRMIAAIGFQRQAVYICNVVKCRPPGNRTPNPDEIEVCSPFLISQIEAIRPRVVCALGACAARTLLGNSIAISRLRGKVHNWRGLSLVCTYHPAYLLRNPEQKAAAWHDLLLVQQLLRASLGEAS
jgi:DNA polymerase